MNWTIELSCGILLTSFTGSVFFLAWYLAGKVLEKTGYVRAKYGLLKITVGSFFLPVSYVFLKSKAVARQLGHGYLFGKTYGLFLAGRIFLAVWGLGLFFWYCACFGGRGGCMESCKDFCPVRQRYVPGLRKYIGASGERGSGCSCSAPTALRHPVCAAYCALRSFCRQSVMGRTNCR